MIRACAALVTVILGCGVAPSVEQPNIIFILCDDLGWGDIGVTYQNQRAADNKIATPYLDQMAREGALLNAHYCPAPVCAPSRASLLTGLHQGHSDIRDNQFDKALPNSHTLASSLKAVGYRTAIVGKYGLQGKGGKSAAEWEAYPTKRGFDDFFGQVRHKDGHVHYPAHAWPIGNNEAHRNPVEIWHNHEEVSQQLQKCYTSDLFTAYAKKWIVDGVNSNDAKPFFLYLAYDTPHAALQFPSAPYPDGGGLSGGVQWQGQPGAMINTATGTIDSWVHPDHAHLPDVEQRQAGMIRRIDDHIGDLMQLLADLRITQNTLMVFSSDNGPHAVSYIAQVKFSAARFQGYGPFAGIKRDTLEGGIRVPTIAWWPGRVPAGQVIQQPGQFHDWLNTFLAAAGAPQQARSDGVSLLPTLTAEGTQEAPTTYVEYSVKGKTPSYDDFAPRHHASPRGQMQVLFMDGYKGIRRNIKKADDDFEIYRVEDDPGETNNLAQSPETEGLQAKLKAEVLRLRRPNQSAKRPYDNEPIPAADDTSTQPGLHVAIRPGVFPWVPRHIAHTEGAITKTTTSPELSLEESAAVEISGYIDVPAAGVYSVSIKAPDAVVLHLHRALVIEGDSPHQDGGTHSADVRLGAGLHPIRLRYVTNQAGVKLSFNGPGEVTYRY